MLFFHRPGLLRKTRLPPKSQQKRQSKGHFCYGKKLARITALRAHHWKVSLVALSPFTISMLYGFGAETVTLCTFGFVTSGFASDTSPNADICMGWTVTCALSDPFRSTSWTRP